MTPIDQTQFAGEGVGGDCVRAAVASILDLPIAAVPHFLAVAEAPGLWEFALEDWLGERGFSIWRSPGHRQFPGYYLAAGPSPRGVSHMVVYRNGAMVHDPHPSRAGIGTVDWTRILVPHDPAAPRSSSSDRGT